MNSCTSEVKRFEHARSACELVSENSVFYSRDTKQLKAGSQHAEIMRARREERLGAHTRKWLQLPNFRCRAGTQAGYVTRPSDMATFLNGQGQGTHDSLGFIHTTDALLTK